jgi:hypothetical protein
MGVLRVIGWTVAVLGALAALAGVALVVYFVFAAAADPGVSDTLANLAGASFVLAFVGLVVGAAGLGLVEASS